MLEIILTIIFLVFLLLQVLSLNKERNNCKKLPGPKGIPLFGNLFQMEYERMYLMLHKLSLQYGDIFQFEVFGQKIVCLSSSETIRNVFLKEPNATICAARPPTFFGKYALENYSEIGFGSPDKIWTTRRKFIHSQIKAYGEGLVRIENALKKNLCLMKLELKRIIGQSVCPKELLDEFVLNSVETLIIGQCSGRNGELQKLLRQLDDHSNTISNPGTDVLYSLFPFLRFLPLRNSYILKELHKEKLQLMKVLSRIAKENPDYKGVYQGLMEEVKKTGEEIHITEQNVRCQFITLVAAGFLTTRGTLSSAVHILSTRPELQKALQEEIDRVVGKDREPSLKDRENCPRIESFLLETLRYFTPAPMSIPHCTTEPCDINGYHVDKGTIIIPNIWTAHHNKTEWNEPFEFQPKRFLDESGNLLPASAPVRKSMQAFGCGKRLCLGEVFARSRMFLFMATLMQTVIINGSDEFDLNRLKPGTILEPLEYKVTFVERK